MYRCSCGRIREEGLGGCLSIWNGPVVVGRSLRALKQFILPEKYFKANLFFPIITPPNLPHHSPSDCRDGDTKRADVGLIKVTLKFILGDL